MSTAGSNMVWCSSSSDIISSSPSSKIIGCKKQQQQHDGVLNNDDENDDSSGMSSSISSSSSSIPEYDRREGRVVTLMKATPLNAARLYIIAGAQLAFEDFNRRSDDILSFLPERLDQCNFFWSWDFLDTKGSPLRAATQFLQDHEYSSHSQLSKLSSENKQQRSQQQVQSPQEKLAQMEASQKQQEQAQAQAQAQAQQQVPQKLQALGQKKQARPPQKTEGKEQEQQQQQEQYENATATATGTGTCGMGSSTTSNKSNGLGLELEPFSVLGGIASPVTRILATIANGYQIPIVSPASGAKYLDRLPYLAQMRPTNVGDVFATYVEESLQISQVAFLFGKQMGIETFLGMIVQPLQQRGITVLSVPFDDHTDQSIQQALQQLAESQYKYIIYVQHSNIDMMRLFQLAYRHGIMGHPGYTWLISGGNSASLVSPNFKVDRTNMDLARAMHGIALIDIIPPSNPQFIRRLTALSTNTTLQQQFIQRFQDPHPIFCKDNNTSYTFPPPLSTVYAYYAYDAVMALGIAACETPALFTGEQLYQSILQTQFQGVSGPVAFHNVTHTRITTGMYYGVKNIVISEQRSTPTHIYFTNHLTSQINMTTRQVYPIQPFVYTDNTTQQPLPIPPVIQNLHLVPETAVIVGLLLAGLVAFTSIICILWTYINRNAPNVRSSQPVFLCQLCFGTIIIALSAIPLSLQEPTPKRQMDLACMSIPWFVSIGFVTSFSALFSKTWRLNKLFQSGINFRRIQIRPVDVIWPFVTLMTINIAILLAWTILDPIQWHRIQMPNYDSFGRSQESFGDCHFESGVRFSIPLLMVNFIPVVIAAYQTWTARKLNIDFSESFCIAVSMASICETTILAIPVLIAARDHTTASYLLRSSFIAVLSFTMLIPIFLPKYIERQQRQESQQELSTSFRLRRFTLAADESMYLNNTRAERPDRDLPRNLHSNINLSVSSMPESFQYSHNVVVPRMSSLPDLSESETTRFKPGKLKIRRNHK